MRCVKLGCRKEQTQCMKFVNVCYRRDTVYEVCKTWILRGTHTIYEFCKLLFFGETQCMRCVKLGC